MAVTNRQEVDAIHRAVFRCAAADVVAERFAQVSARLDALHSEEEVRRYREAVARVGDLEALEVAARYRRQLPLLTEKVRAMVYLAETIPANQSHFVSTSRRRWSAFGAVFWGAIRTTFKMIKGLALLSRVSGA